MAITREEQTKLFNNFRATVGAPLRNIEITDDQLCILLELSIEDYSQAVQNYLIEHQWQSLLGQNVDTLDMAFALSVRGMNFSTQYTYAYSKQVGLQTNGPWELKKDFIDIEAGRQVYQIPAGREVNEVLWITPSTVNQSLMASYGGLDAGFGFGGGFAQVGGGYGSTTGGYAGRSGYYIAPAFDVLLMASDMNLKNRIVRSELTYKVTAGPNGTKLLHLISTPGSKLSFGLGVGSRVSNGINLTGCRVWYHYYDTTDANVDDCRNDNPDIIKMPNDVPLDKLDYASFNEPTKVLIRQILFAKAKQTLGKTRGKFLGVIGLPEGERTLDWETMTTEGNEEYKAVMEKLEERLARLSSTEQLKRAAEEAEFLNTQLKYRPLGIYVK
jgi:hypothetical protein